MKIKCFFISIVATALMLAGGSALLAPQPAMAAEGVLVASSHEKGRTDAVEDDNSCESRGGVLAWIMCPVVMAADAALNWIDTQIQALLAVDKGLYDNPGMKNAWASIRNIAYIILLPIMMVMVIGTAVGIEMFSAYTVKKALPRMVAAVIFITLSWPICTFLIGFFNVIGGGILGLITSPFNSPGRVVSTLSLADLYGRGNLLLDLLKFLPTVAGAAAGIIFILWMYWNVILLFAGIAFMVLLLRSIFIVALVLLAPLAILAWIFPGNDKLWKSWWSLFSKLLIMFPLIMAILAVGRVFAVIIHDGGWGALQGTFLRPITILMVYMLPYVFIPFTFKFAGGVFATISGIANDRSKGLFDRARKGREHKLERTKEGNMFRSAPEGSWRSGLNLGAAGAANIRKAGFDPRRMRSKMRTALRDDAEAKVAKFAQESESFSVWGGDDAKLSAARFYNHDDIGRELERFDAGRFAGAGNARAREDAISQIMRTQREVDNETFQRARVRNQAKTGTGYQRRVVDENGVEHTIFDANLMLDDINETYGNDRNGAGRALAEMRTSLAQSGQIAGVAGYGTWGGALEDRFYNRPTAGDAHNRIMDDAINSASPSQALYGKPASAAAMAQAHARRIQAIAADVAAGRRGQGDLSAAVAGAAGLYDAMAQASPQNASAFANELMDVEVGAPIYRQDGTVVTGGTVREYIEEQMGRDREFVNRRRDFSVSTGERAAAERAALAQRAAGSQPGAGGPPPTTPPMGPPAPPV